MPIYELSYQRMAGKRTPERMRFVPIALAGVRQFIKKKPHVALLLASLIPFLFAMVIRTMPYWAPERLQLKALGPLLNALHLGHATAYLYISQFARIFIILIAMLSASGAIANDLRSNALEIYFSRPITRLDYILGKLGTTLGMIGVVILLPLIVLFFIDIALTDTPGFLMAQLPLLQRLIAAVLVVAVPFTLITLALSALGRSQRTVTILFLTLWIGSKALALTLTSVTRNPSFQLIDISAVIDRVLFAVLDVARGIEELRQVVPELDKIRVPMSRVPTGQAAMVLSGWVALSILVLRARVRGFEVVKT